MSFASDFGLGSLISNLSESYGTGKVRKDKDDERARNMSQWNSEQARRQVTPDLMARMEAFKAAGLHPLVGLGMGGGGGGPVISSASSVAPPTPQFQFSSDREVKVDPDIARWNKARADQAEIDVQIAQKRLAEQPGQASPGSVVVNAYDDPSRGFANPLELNPMYRNAVKLKPDEMTSRDASHEGRTAGRDHPGMRQFVLPGGFRMLLPDTGQGGMPEEVEASMLPLVIGANIQTYGARWIGDYLRYMMGTNPGEPGWIGNSLDAITDVLRSKDRRPVFERR